MNQKITKIVLALIGCLIIVHTALRMEGNDMIIQICLGVTTILLGLTAKFNKEENNTEIYLV